MFQKVGLARRRSRAFGRGFGQGCARTASWRPIEQATMAYDDGISLAAAAARATWCFASEGEIKSVTLVKRDTG